MSLIYSSIQKKSFRSPKSIVFCDKHHRSREFLTMFNVEALSVELLNVEFRTNGVKQSADRTPTTHVGSLPRFLRSCSAGGAQQVRSAISSAQLLCLSRSSPDSHGSRRAEGKLDLYNTEIHYIVGADSPLNYLHDIRNAKINGGPPLLRPIACCGRRRLR